MDAMFAGLVGIFLLGGIALVIAGVRRHPERISTASSTTVWKRVREAWTSAPRSRKIWAVGAIAAGLVAYALTGWLLMLGVVPLGLLGVPWLLADPPNREIDLLAALDRWIRVISSSLPTGKSIRDAIRATRSQVPAVLQRPVGLLLARLDDRWPTRDAFYAMADDLNSSDADTVLAALALATERGGIGAVATLNALSDSIQDRLRATREIETERAKPRIVARHVTLISAVMLGGALLFGGRFFAPYRTSIGLVILVALLAAYAGSLLMLKRMSQPQKRERLLVWSGGKRA